jgi:hypothetical protein
LWGRPELRAEMRDRIPNRGWLGAALCGLLGAALCGLLGAALSGNALASSSVSGTAPTPGTQATPSTAASSSPAHKSVSAPRASSAPKSGTHSSSAHKTSHKAGSSHVGTQQASNGHGKKGSKSSRTSSRSSKKRGQQAIDHERATAIQEALIREHYLHGEPSGSWDTSTQAAMQKYQADQGWQSKTTPDSRALIKLGLGPSKDHLLNPESAMTSAPAGAPKGAAKADPTANGLPQQ